MEPVPPAYSNPSKPFFLVLRIPHFSDSLFSAQSFLTSPFSYTSRDIPFISLPDNPHLDILSFQTPFFESRTHPPLTFLTSLANTTPEYPCVTSPSLGTDYYLPCNLHSYSFTFLTRSDGLRVASPSWNVNFQPGFKRIERV